MKIDFSDINDFGSCFARELKLLKQAIYESIDKDEISVQQLKIELASLECQDKILSKMLKNSKEDLNVNTITDQ